MAPASANQAASQNNANVTLLALLVDDDGDGEYRFLVDGKHVKCVTVGPGALPEDDRTFAPNEGYVAKDEATGKLVFTHTVRNDKLKGVKNAWHPFQIDILELQPVSGGSRIKQNIHRVTHPTLFEGKTVIAKSAEFPWQMPYYEAETTAYSWIQGTGNGPEFLGHVTEAGRIIGFVVEYIEDTLAAGPEDLPACQRALARLHALGIRHGDINRYNFLVRGDTAVLIDFEFAQQNCSTEELAAKADLLVSSLQDESSRGGPRRAFAE